MVCGCLEKCLPELSLIKHIPGISKRRPSRTEEEPFYEHDDRYKCCGFKVSNAGPIFGLLTAICIGLKLGLVLLLSGKPSRWDVGAGTVGLIIIIVATLFLIAGLRKVTILSLMGFSLLLCTISIVLEFVNFLYGSLRTTFTPPQAKAGTGMTSVTTTVQGRMSESMVSDRNRTFSIIAGFLLTARILAFAAVIFYFFVVLRACFYVKNKRPAILRAEREQKELAGFRERLASSNLQP